MYFSTAQEMERLDELAVENGLEIRQMMELAGWHILGVFRELKIPTGARVVIAVGKGNKGGDGLAAARHLANYGFSVSVILSAHDIKPDPAHHAALLKQMGVPMILFQKDRDQSQRLIRQADVIIDALIGYHLQGEPRGDMADIIRTIRDREPIAGKSALVIAYDLPSGMNATTGDVGDTRIEAQATLTLAMPKKCFKNPSARALAGDIFLADIGIPAFLYNLVRQGSRPDFGASGLIAI